MNTNHVGVLEPRLAVLKQWTVQAVVLGCLLFAAATVHGQNSFNSASTGTDGAFAPTTSQSIAVPASGTFNFTTVNIPSGVTITFTRNATNTPLTILASGDVVIAGNINIDGQPGSTNNTGGLGGPGGSNGGAGGYGFDQSSSGVPGDGPGGGGGGLGKPTAYAGAGGGGGFGTAGQPGQNVPNFNGVGG